MVLLVVGMVSVRCSYSHPFANQSHPHHMFLIVDAKMGCASGLATPLEHLVLSVVMAVPLVGSFLSEYGSVALVGSFLSGYGSAS